MKSRENFIKFSEGNIYPDPISDREALDILKTFFLGEDWYIVDPVSPGQGNVYLVDAILNSFPRKYKKFRKNMGWDKQPSTTDYLLARWRSISLSDTTH